MKLFGVSLALAAVLTLSAAGPINSTLTRQLGGYCDYKRQRCISLFVAFCPQCDSYGNFLPQQCSGSTGYCWCVDVITGDEIPNTRTPPGAVPINCDVNMQCPSGWSRFGHRCFIFIDAPKTWAEAELYCQFDHANLASVHSYEENRFLQSLTRGNTHDFPETWIGGDDAIHLGLWMWSDGSKFNYENWYDDDHDEKTERCLMMNYRYDLKWTAALCNGTLPFVCSKSA